MPPVTIVLRACAPTQSWGTVGNLSDNRPTSPWPLHSAITGLLCRAAGIDDTDTAAIARVGDSPMAIRVDNPGHITSDFQTVSNTVDSHLKPRGTILTRRGEIQDGCFTVFRQYVDTALGRDLHAALRTPAKVLFLGRRCHLITAPLHTGTADTAIDDDLIGSWPTCHRHPPTDNTWPILEHTTAPLHEPGVTMTGQTAVSFRPLRHRLAAVRQRRIPRTTPAAPPTTRRLAVTGDGSVIDLDQETP